MHDIVEIVRTQIRKDLIVLLLFFKNVGTKYRTHVCLVEAANSLSIMYDWIPKLICPKITHINCIIRRKAISIWKQKTFLYQAFCFNLKTAANTRSGGSEGSSMSRLICVCPHCTVLNLIMTSTLSASTLSVKRDWLCQFKGGNRH